MNLEEQIAEAMIRATTAPAEAGDDAVKRCREEDNNIWHFARVQARAAIDVVMAEALKHNTAIEVVNALTAP